jgi:hypothetical protein
MSLINEALKQAQRQRAKEQADLAAPMPGSGGPTMRRTAPALSSQTLVLLVGGGITLFVVCVVAAVLWINRPDPAKPAPVKNAQAATAKSSATAGNMITLPAMSKPDASGANVTPLAAGPASLTPASAALALARAQSPSPTLVTEAVPAPAPPTRPTGTFKEHIQVMIDAYRVPGLRAEGDDSKVLLNDRVYKLNDIVDRANSLRLTKVASDGLEFTTPDGFVYEKTF